MFERSLIISQDNHVLAGQRWTAAASTAVQVALAGLVIALPMLHPERLSLREAAPLAAPALRVPVPPLPKVKPVVMAAAASSASTETYVPAEGHSLLAPGVIHHGVVLDDGPPPQPLIGMGSGTGGPSGLTGLGDAPVRAVSVAPVRTVRVSEGVSVGLLLTPIRPVYPMIAKATRTEGTVVVEATISTAGRIESLHVVSGPEMLRGAALEAIAAARYQPYRLNGAPTAVQTTITVRFVLG